MWGLVVEACTHTSTHLYGCGLGVHNFLVDSHGNHNGVDLTELILRFLENTHKHTHNMTKPNDTTSYKMLYIKTENQLLRQL